MGVHLSRSKTPSYLDLRVSEVVSRAESLSKELTVTVNDLVELLQTYKAKADAADGQ